MGAKLTLGAAGPNVRFPPIADVDRGLAFTAKRTLVS
jgi:hypothetical protein